MEAHVVRNFDALAATPLRSDALTIAEAGYRALATPVVVRRAVARDHATLTVAGKPYDITAYEHCYLLAVGKCALDASRELETILGDFLTEGVALDVREGSLERVRGYVCTHPYPSAQNATATRALLDLATQATERDLVLCVVSGGGSALLTQPLSHTPLAEAELIRHLFRRGATITELNMVRKHLSTARGGGVAAAAYPATVVSLIFSDVPGDDIAIISSAPTVRDTTTCADARAVLERYGADRAGFPATHLIETPKRDELFRRVRNELVLTNETALIAMRDCAEGLGYHTLIRDTQMVGEARAVGATIAAEIAAARPRSVLLYGGETTVTISGKGTGGRNEELALGALLTVGTAELVVSLASDGRDNTDLAGGIADAVTRGEAERRGLDPTDFLGRNDSHTFFHTLQQGVDTGYTGTNVADLVIAIKQ